MATMKYEQLRGMSDEDLIERFNKVAESTTTGLSFIRDELHRREM